LFFCRHVIHTKFLLIAFNGNVYLQESAHHHFVFIVAKFCTIPKGIDEGIDV
jgi:hypothetical protein